MTASATLTLPTIHDNGTSRAALACGYMSARDALQTAWDRLKEASPNGRDYYPQGTEAMARADNQHRERLRHVQIVLDELEILIMHCDGD